MENKKVLLTGITGFLGSHTAIQLLNKGYLVTGTVRSADKINAIRNVIAAHTSHIDHLTIEVASLNDAQVWDRLTRDMDYVQHVASPIPRALPKHEDELIIPAQQGTLNVLRAASANGVKRVVLTSSLSAIAYGRPEIDPEKVFTEADWTDINSKKDLTPYYKSKTIAEKTAWDFIKSVHTDLELVTVCPGIILGPVLEEDFGTSANLIVSLMNGSFPALPKIGFDVVDVRSVADLLIKAMEAPQAAGNRYLCASSYLTLKDIALIVKQHFPERKIPTAELPNFMARILALFQPALKPVLLELVKRKTNLNKAKKELKWEPLPAKDAVIACAESILEHKIVA